MVKVTVQSPLIESVDAGWSSAIAVQHRAAHTIAICKTIWLLLMKSVTTPSFLSRGTHLGGFIEGN